VPFGAATPWPSAEAEALLLLQGSSTSIFTGTLCLLLLLLP
jgi:hypothetical protein